jgi:hypothetical protein
MNESVVSDKKEPTLWAAFRSGIRVSDAVYYTKNDPSLIKEKEYWDNILRRHPDGTVMDIMPVRYRDRR